MAKTKLHYRRTISDGRGGNVRLEYQGRCLRTYVRTTNVATAVTCKDCLRMMQPNNCITAPDCGNAGAGVTQRQP